MIRALETTWMTWEWSDLDDLMTEKSLQEASDLHEAHRLQTLINICGPKVESVFLEINENQASKCIQGPAPPPKRPPGPSANDSELNSSIAPKPYWPTGIAIPRSTKRRM
jgi:hypothetical protein